MKYVAQPQISEEELSLVTEAIQAKGFVEGKYARKLEDEFADFTSAKYAICAATGTAALHLAFEGLNIPPGSEVITTAFTFIASANTVSFGGCIPIFADIDPQTYNIDPEKIEELITPRTKAILPVHIFGLPADMKAINDIATDHDLVVIEDACQAHGAAIEGKHVGTMSQIGCFSFYATKNMTTGEGGMIVTDNEELATRIRSLKNHGRGVQGGYNHYIIGYNYRLPDPLAAIGLAQLRRLPPMLEKRHANAEMIRKTVEEINVISNQKIPSGFTHSHYVCAPVIEDITKFRPEEIIEQLRVKGIGSRQIYSIPCHQQPTYLKGIKSWRWNSFVNYPDYSQVKLPETERIATSHFEIPIHPGVSEEEIAFIQETLRNLFR